MYKTTLSADRQVTLPPELVQALGLQPGDCIQLVPLGNGRWELVGSNTAPASGDAAPLGDAVRKMKPMPGFMRDGRGNSDNEDETRAMLDYLDRDIAQHPERLQPIPEELVKRANELVGGFEVDLDAPLRPEPDTGGSG